MSIVKIQGNASGTGTLTIAAPNTNSDVTINLPTVTGGDFIVSNSSGNVGIGTSNTPSNKDTVTPKLIVNGAGVAGSMQVVRNTTVGVGGALLELTSTRGTDVNSYTILQSGDGVGSVVFGGADGNEFVRAAGISCQVDGTPGDNDMPGRLVFETTADGASSSTERMRIDSSGNVGIGTSSPSYRLDAQTTATGTAAGDNTAGYFGSQASGRDVNIRLGDSVNATARLGYLSGALYMYTNGAERMRIDSSGNVGIGTSSPSTYVSNGGLAILGTFGTSSKALTIYNNSGASASNVARIDFKLNNTFSNGSTSAAIYGMNPNAAGNNGGALVFATSSDGTDTNPTERARIDSSGNLLLNTTSNPGTAAKFVISGNSDGTYNPMTVVQEAAGSTSRTSIQFYRNSASAVVGTITTTNAATAYVTSSDYRLKHDIQPMAGALAKVAALKPVTYKWKIDDSQSQGFIAHELQAVVPEAVVGEKDAVDAEGKPQYQGIDTSFLVATLTAAIQEQQAIITALTARVEALEGQA